MARAVLRPSATLAGCVRRRLPPPLLPLHSNHAPRAPTRHPRDAPPPPSRAVGNMAFAKLAHAESPGMEEMVGRHCPQEPRMPVCAYRGSCARLPAWHPAGAGRRFERVSETYAWAYRLQRCGLNGVDTPHGRALFALVNASAPAASSEPSPPPPPLHRSPARRGSHRPCRAPVTGLRSGLGAVGLLERWEESAAAGLKRHLRPICPPAGAQGPGRSCAPQSAA